MKCSAAVLRVWILILSLTALGVSACTQDGKTPQGGSPPVHVEGTWTGTAQQTGSPNPTFTLKLNVKEGGEVWGTITSMDGTFHEAIISGGRIENNELIFSATANGTNFRQGRSYAFKAQLQGDQMEGIWKDVLERNWGSFTVERVKPVLEKKL